MAYDHDEQEQLASIKAWWAQYGNIITWVLIIVLTAYAGWNGWKIYEGKQAAQAAQLYAEFQKAQSENDAERIERTANDLKSKFGRTAYGSMVALQAAQSAQAAGNADGTKKHLQWVIDNGKDAAHIALARIRLAGVLLDESAHDAALKTLDFKVNTQMAGLVDDRRGDILVAQNKLEEARAAYQSALNKLGEANPGREFIRLKLDALGGEHEVAAS